jgi:ABC-type glycerol-3-phosphate transport system permease component
MMRRLFFRCHRHTGLVTNGRESSPAVKTTSPYFWHNFANSFYVASMTTLLNLFFCSLAAAPSRFINSRVKRLLFNLVLGTMLLARFFKIESPMP